MHCLRHIVKFALAALLLAPVSVLACEDERIDSEHLTVDSAANYYLVAVKRAHGDNLVGTIERSFRGDIGAGQTLSIQFVETALVEAPCPMAFTAGQTYLLRAKQVGGALQASRFDRGNVPADHPRFQTYVLDIESAQAQ